MILQAKTFLNVLENGYEGKTFTATLSLYSAAAFILAIIGTIINVAFGVNTACGAIVVGVLILHAARHALVFWLRRKVQCAPESIKAYCALEHCKVESDVFLSAASSANIGKERKAPVGELISARFKNTFKIAPLGISGSGKTSFLSGLYYTLGPGARDFTSFDMSLSHNNPAQRLWRTNDWGSINLGKSQDWPHGTAETSLSEFTISLKSLQGRGDKGIAFPQIDWLDYPGGLLSVQSRSSPNTQDRVRGIMDYFRQTDAFLITLDAIELTRHKRDVAYFTCGAPIIKLLLESFKLMQTQDVVIVVALTKSDAIAPHYKSDNYAPLLDEANKTFAPLIEFLRANFTSVGIVPVSAIGETASQMLPNSGVIQHIIKGYPQPMNLNEALFFTLGKHIAIQKSNVIERIKQVRAQQEKTLNAGAFFKHLMGRGNQLKQLRELYKQDESLYILANDMYVKSLSRVDLLK